MSNELRELRQRKKSHFVDNNTQFVGVVNIQKRKNNSILYIQPQVCSKIQLNN